MFTSCYLETYFSYIKSSVSLILVTWLPTHFHLASVKSIFDLGPCHPLGGWQVPSRGPPVRHSLQMSTKPVTTRATTATRAGCVRHGVGHNRAGWVQGRIQLMRGPRLIHFWGPFFHCYEEKWKSAIQFEFSRKWRCGRSESTVNKIF